MYRIKKYIIWGAGFRGEKLFSVLTSKRVMAFIDNDLNKIGTKKNGIPIIDFTTYYNYYQNVFIIISVTEYKKIENFLIKNKIYQYFILSECPSEFKGYGVSDLDYLLDFDIDKDSNNIIVGSNLFSFILYEKIKIDGCNKKLYCYPNREHSQETIEKMKELLDVNIELDVKEKLEISDKVYVTTREKSITKEFESFGLEMINAYDFSYKIKQYYNPLIEKFKNRHLGQRCFIVATGPSLKNEDIDILYKNKELCFSMNRIFKLENRRWKPDYYVAVDTMFLRDYKEEIMEYPVDVKFINNFMEEEEQKNISLPYRIHCVTDDIVLQQPMFSDDISRVVYGGATVTYVCIQIAIYMGFKEIYLLGVDCKYSKGSSKNYFFQDKENDHMNHNEDRMILSYQAAKQYADLHGIKIYNATRNGMLEVFDRVDFDELFNR